MIVMGGAVEVPGNVTAYAEFNIYNDPLAADMVLNSGVPVTLVGLDVTMQTSNRQTGRAVGRGRVGHCAAGEANRRKPNFGRAQMQASTTCTTRWPSRPRSSRACSTTGKPRSASSGKVRSVAGRSPDTATGQSRWRWQSTLSVQSA